MKGGEAAGKPSVLYLACSQANSAGITEIPWNDARRKGHRKIRVALEGTGRSGGENDPQTRRSAIGYARFHARRTLLGRKFYNKGRLVWSLCAPCQEHRSRITRELY